jgi:hypothetical protein
LDARTARCLGYPSDSMCAARERVPGDILHSPPPRWLGSPLSLSNSLSPGRRRRSAIQPRALGGQSGALAIASDQTRPQRRCRRHRRAAGGGTGPAGTAGGYRRAVCSLPHLAGVGGQPLANGYGRSAGTARGSARSNRATASLPLSSACSGGRAWAGTVRGWKSRRVVFMEGQCRGTALRPCVFSWAAAGVADRQRHAASPVSGSPD